MRKILETPHDVGPFLARLFLGLFILPHGMQKVLGVWGGHGIEATVSGMGANLGIPAPLAYLAIAAEFLGGIGLILGLLSRVSAFGVIVTMAVAAVMVHWQGGFFSGPNGAGMELHFLAIGLGLVVLVKGGGAWSIDRALTKERAYSENVSGRRAMAS